MRSVSLVIASLALLGCVSLSSSEFVNSVSAQTNSTSTATGSNPIVVRGTALIDSVTSERFFSHGAGYDYSVSDAQEAQWMPALTKLLSDAPAINTLRIYIIDPTASHTKFMQFTQSKGIYVVLPMTPSSGCVLDEFGTPALDANTCYPSCLLSYGQQIVNQFAIYTNVLAFMVGNEVLRDETRWKAAPCVKGYARDIKAYMNSCPSMRVVPLMYADSDDATPQDDADANNRRKADYLTCGPAAERIDIYGINTFRWCNSECTYEKCRWKDLHDAMTGVGIPVLLTEHGCDNYRYDPLGANIQGQREWKEMAVLASQPMSNTFSGGMAYTFGVRGAGGSVSEFGFPGATKTCGYGGVGLTTCNIDNYQTQVAAVLAKPLPTQAQADPATRFATNPVCKPYLNYDLTTPTSRQGADGYIPQTCPAAGTGKIPDSTGTPLVTDTTTPISSNMQSTATLTTSQTQTSSTGSSAGQSSTPSTTIKSSSTGGASSVSSGASQSSSGANSTSNGINPSATGSNNSANSASTISIGLASIVVVIATLVL